MTILPRIRPPIEASQLYKGLEAINPAVALKIQDKVIPLAEKLIKNGGKTLELPATSENMVAWLNIQPRDESQGERDYQKFLARMTSASTRLGTDQREELELVADFFQNFAEERRLAPAQALKMREYVIKAKPETVWQALCSCPLIFL